MLERYLTHCWRRNEDTAVSVYAQFQAALIHDVLALSRLTTDGTL